MVVKRLCDVCGEEIGRTWLHVEGRYRERDYGIELASGGAYDVCSPECLKRLAEKMMKPREVKVVER